MASMETQGNGCFMEYKFNGESHQLGSISYLISHPGVGVSVGMYLGNMHGPFGCSIDGKPLQWFNVIPAIPDAYSFGSGCIMNGLTPGEHTLRVVNSPMPGWFLRVTDITVVSSSGAANTPSFSYVHPDDTLDSVLNSCMLYYTWLRHHPQLSNASKIGDNSQCPAERDA